MPHSSRYDGPSAGGQRIGPDGIFRRAATARQISFHCQYRVAALLRKQPAACPGSCPEQRTDKGMRHVEPFTLQGGQARWRDDFHFFLISRLCFKKIKIKTNILFIHVYELYIVGVQLLSSFNHGQTQPTRLGASPPCLRPSLCVPSPFRILHRGKEFALRLAGGSYVEVFVSWERIDRCVPSRWAR